MKASLTSLVAPALSNAGAVGLAVTVTGALRNDPRSPTSLSGPVLGSSYTVIALTSPPPILDTT